MCIEFYKFRSRLFDFIGLAITLMAFSCTSPRLTTIPTVDPNATDETKALFTKLWMLGRSNRTLFGHQDDNLYGVGWRLEPGRSDVLAVTGSYPGVYGFELSQLELGVPENDEHVPFDLVHDRIIEAYQRGGAITISWHMTNPVTGGNFLDTTPAVSTILPGGSNHALYLSWLDQFAQFDRSLIVSGVPWNQNEHLVPVIFRPFHEHNWSGFWWGGHNTTAADYIALWQFTVQYLRDTAGLHNLLYAYSPDTRGRSSRDLDTFKAWYEYGFPGDDYVDVFGMDNYANPELDQLDAYEESLDMLVRYTRTRNNPKVPALTETGHQKWTGRYSAEWWTTFLYPAVVGSRPRGQVAWALVWRNSLGTDSNYGAPFPGQLSEGDFIEFKEKRAILFQDEIPPINLYAWP